MTGASSADHILMAEDLLDMAHDLPPAEAMDWIAAANAHAVLALAVRAAPTVRLAVTGHPSFQLPTTTLGLKR